MSNFFQFFIHLLVISAFLLIFIMTFVFIKPFRINRRRMVSTIVLKTGYLVYMLILLSFFYFLIFVDKDLQDLITDNHFILILLCLFVPNIGILIRRKIRKRRTDYNYLVTFINLIAITYLIYMFYQIRLINWIMGSLFSVPGSQLQFQVTGYELQALVTCFYQMYPLYFYLLSWSVIQWSFDSHLLARLNYSGRLTIAVIRFAVIWRLATGSFTLCTLLYALISTI